MHTKLLKHEISSLIKTGLRTKFPHDFQDKQTTEIPVTSRALGADPGEAPAIAKLFEPGADRGRPREAKRTHPCLLRWCLFSSIRRKFTQ